MLCQACYDFLQTFQFQVKADSSERKNGDFGNHRHHDSYVSFKNAVSRGCLICKKAWSTLLSRKEFSTQAQQDPPAWFKLTAEWTIGDFGLTTFTLQFWNGPERVTFDSFNLTPCEEEQGKPAEHFRSSSTIVG
jgi:hypothetical protein